MDPHRAGPSIGIVLTRQPMHRSSLLWDAPLAGVLTCRHRDKGLFDGGLDPWIATYITDAGLDGLLRVPHMDLDHALITALVERWRPETHSFHLPHGEMTITLQDIEVIMGVPVHGLPVVGFTHMDNWGDFCIDLLGFLPPDRPVGTKKNIAVLEGPRIKAKWLEEQFRNPLPTDATEVRVQQYARYYILQMLGSILFMDKSGERLSIIHLCKASEKTAKQIGGALLLVQLWAWARFPQICPVMRHPQQALPPGPLAVRWKRAKITTDHPMHVLRAYRVSLASLRPNQIVWEPYRDYLGSLPAYCTAGQHIWRSIMPLIHFWVIEGHHPERVLRQFGMEQGVPDNVDTSIELHKITLQGKHEKNWVQEHATHIARWAAHATIAEAPPFHGVMSYNDEYMVWYRSITVRHITKETSYWDTLVESQLRIMAKFEPGSEIYTDCMNALQSVEEINRLTLDDARTVGNASEPAVGHG
ncbi:serine/threonine-protein phosphatase 7 long form homolog [Castanea sativa]|uniref:serine/threonine-protein phosphatase 7 long form homolog n=1 Tax=Castanea sativa TaxID=21020 RepID=UPI003F64C1A4